MPSPLSSHRAALGLAALSDDPLAADEDRLDVTIVAQREQLVQQVVRVLCHASLIGTHHWRVRGHHHGVEALADVERADLLAQAEGLRARLRGEVESRVDRGGEQGVRGVTIGVTKV